MDRASQQTDLEGILHQRPIQPPLAGEITDRKQLEKLLRLKRKILEAMALNRGFGQVLDQLCQLIERMVPGSLATVMLLDGARGILTLEASPSLPARAVKMLNGLVPGVGAGSCGAAACCGEPVYVTDTHTDPRWADLQHVAKELGVRACWSVPILSESKSVVGTFAISSMECRCPTPFHTRLLESASYLAGIAIQRKQQDDAMQALETRLHRITDAVPGALCQFHLTPKSKPRFTFISKGAGELWGMPIRELRHDHTLMWRMVLEEDKRAVRASLRGAASNGHPWSHEFRLRRTDGELRWVRMSAALDRSAERPHSTWNGIMVDITDRRLAEQRLSQWAAAFENISEGVIITDTRGRIQDVNRAFCNITGYSRDEVTGQTTSFLHSGRHEAAFYQAMWATLRSAGKWQGEIWNRRKNGEVFPEWLSISPVSNEQDELTNYVGVFADITTIKESERQLLHLAHHDPLTGLPNRLLFSARLEHTLQQAKRVPATIGLLFLDLDRFKNVNDSLGHALGDELLTQAAHRLRSCVRQQDTVARLGGDEFIVILQNLASARDAGAVAEKILAALQQPFALTGHEVTVTASIGISLCPDDGQESNTLLRNADAAMYRAKELGCNSYAYYTPELTTIVRERFDLENNLRRALERDEFRLFFQAQVSAADGRIVGAEALLRWQHPELGLVIPDKFIPLAEETGLITPIGEWVLRAACAQAKQWRSWGLPPVRLAINLSGQQIMSEFINDKLEKLLEEVQLEPSCLEFEITESFVMKHPEQAVQVLDKLRTLGISLAIDDFGSGYSSLGYLKRLPVHKLKIDQSLVRDIPSDPNDKAIARAVIALGHSLGLTVIAEGVETEMQGEFVRAEGCDQFQGYLYGRPTPAEEFAEQLKNNWSVE